MPSHKGKIKPPPYEESQPIGTLKWLTVAALAISLPLTYSILKPNKIAITFPHYSHKIVSPIEPTAVIKPQEPIFVPYIPELQHNATRDETEQPRSDGDLRDDVPVVGVSPDDLIVIDGINALRGAQGLKPYHTNSCLQRAASLRIDDMVSKGYFSHTSPEGLHSSAFILQANYHYKFAGENLARGYGSITEAIDAWKASPTHYANILDKDFVDTGVAISGDLIVQLFASGDSLCK